MEWLTIALAIILPVCILGGIFYLLVRRPNRQIKSAVPHSRISVWAAAKVISMEQVSHAGDGYGMVHAKLQLRVIRRSGKSYLASTAWLVDPVYLPQIQPGSELSIRVNRKHPEIIYPNMPGMEAFHGP